MKQPHPHICDLSPFITAPLGTICVTDSASSFGENDNETSKNRVPGSPPRVLQNQHSGGKGTGGGRHENNTNPRAICVKGWKSSSLLLSKKFLLLSAHKGFHFLHLMYQTVLCDGEHWLGKAQKLLPLPPPPAPGF